MTILGKEDHMLHVAVGEIIKRCMDGEGTVRNTGCKERNSVVWGLRSHSPSPLSGCLWELTVSKPQFSHL
jgi:hypothetical protein